MHELRHAEQKKILIEDYEKYDKYFLRNMITNTIRSYYYPCDHDKLYSEYDAFVNPMFDITKVGELTKADVSKIRDIVLTKTTISSQNIVVVEVN